MMWTTGSKNLLAKIPKLHVDRTISYRHLTECFLSVVKTGDNESCLKEVVSEVLYFLLGSIFAICFHHTKRLSFCLTVIHVHGSFLV